MESELNKGTRLTVKLARQLSAPQAESARLIKEGLMTGPKSILIVDDEEDIRTYLCTLLGDQGYETVLAKDGEAMQKCGKHLPDLITLDISMPENRGSGSFAR